MAEYIEREAHTCKDCFHWISCKKMLEAAGFIISEDYNPNASRCDTFIPTADVVEVPCRCKDCRHWTFFENCGCSDHGKVCGLAGYMIGPMGYCLYGERIDGE